MATTIEQRVMAAVGVIYAVRLLLSRTALELYALAAAAVAIWQLTWVHMVWSNFAHVAHGGAGPTSAYLLYAVAHTHLAVQLALAVAAAAAAGLIIDAVRAIRPLHPRPSLLLPQ